MSGLGQPQPQPETASEGSTGGGTPTVASGMFPGGECPGCDTTRALEEFGFVDEAAMFRRTCFIARDALATRKLPQPGCQGAIGYLLVGSEVISQQASAPNLTTPPSEAAALRLGQRLRRARLNRNLTQGEIAKNMFSTGYLSAVERGQIRPSLGALEKLAERLQVPITELLSDEPDAQPPSPEPPEENE